MIHGIMTMRHNRAYLIKSLLIRVIAFLTSHCQQLFLLLFFGIQHFQSDQTFVHTDGIFPVISGGSIFACIMYAYCRIFQHLIHQYGLPCLTYVVAHEVGCLHSFFHFVGNHVAPVASGKSHDKCKITFFNSCQADCQMFLYL